MSGNRRCSRINVDEGGNRLRLLRHPSRALLFHHVDRLALVLGACVCFEFTIADLHQTSTKADRSEHSRKVEKFQENICTSVFRALTSHDRVMSTALYWFSVRSFSSSSWLRSCIKRPKKTRKHRWNFWGHPFATSCEYKEVTPNYKRVFRSRTSFAVPQRHICIHIEYQEWESFYFVACFPTSCQHFSAHKLTSHGIQKQSNRQEKISKR